MLVSWDPPASLAGAALRFGWLSFALVLAWRAAGIGFGQPQLGSVGDLSEYVPVFVTLDPRAQRRTLKGVTSFPFVMTGVFIFLSLPWGLFSTFLRELTGEAEAEPHTAAILAAVVSLLASLGLLTDAHRRSCRNARTARALLSAPPRRGTEPGWRSVRGIIAPGSSWSHAVDVKEEIFGGGSAESTNLHLHERSRVPERIIVKTDTGEPLEVCLTGAAWGTRRLSWTATEGRASQIVLSPDAASRAIVVGHFEPDSTRLEARGPETLILYTNGDAGDPRHALQTRLWLQRVGWLLPLFAAAIVYARSALS